MSFDNAVIATRKKAGDFMAESSYAGISWKDPLGKLTTRLLSPHDFNVSLIVQIYTTPQGLTISEAAYTYVGRFLDRVLCVGREDFQVFRVHLNTFDPLCLSEDMIHYGELISQKTDPKTNAKIVVEFEPIWGPRWEDTALLRAWGMGEIKKREQIFINCPFPLAETAEQYMRHKTWHTHPGVLPSMSEADYFEMQAMMTRTEGHLACPRVM